MLNFSIIRTFGDSIQIETLRLSNNVRIFQNGYAICVQEVIHGQDSIRPSAIKNTITVDFFSLNGRFVNGFSIIRPKNLYRAASKRTLNPLRSFRVRVGKFTATYFLIYSLLYSLIKIHKKNRFLLKFILFVLPVFNDRGF